MITAYEAYEIINRKFQGKIITDTITETSNDYIIPVEGDSATSFTSVTKDTGMIRTMSIFEYVTEVDNNTVKEINISTLIKEVV